ncbi:MAG: tRNA (adenosine(37)-N6)-threonylcarbamoyltransferase complex ATPase subunit type 1 TsaE [Anaerolineales bacterium]|nr:tRNA (adenosine(37)-N6)-threonylcarbamoyltransferase complex ATPase subunit type 1 TsaE [Anaerolineales bacterium]MCK5430668.1 tRNA (adenosine(37)-N6)-threonylcarbamoyltransferase complex ATPase subunit type 1 TsaE [Anaerolineales bacterium]
MPILDPHSMEFISRSAEQTRRIGMRLGALLQRGDIICLVGDLGSGKTTFVQGVASGWGSLDPVTSPSFVLVNIYRGTNEQRFYHLDAYRLSDALEAEALDLDAMIESGPLVIEWADRIQDALPDECLWVTLHWIDRGQRDMLVSARGGRYQDLLTTIRRQVYGVV